MTAGPHPLTRQRSPWVHVGSMPTVPGYVAQAFHREVADGFLRALVAEEPMGWHMSISFVDRKDRPSRYPRWDEITHARGELLPADVGFVMTFHLHEHPERP